MSLTEQAIQRHRIIDGTFNVRDIGGYQTEDGRMTRWRTVLRSDKLDKLTHIGQKQLSELGLHSVIDLRYTPEVQESPDVIADTAAYGYQHIPLYELSGTEQLPDVPSGAQDLYVLMLEHRKKQVKAIFDLLDTRDTYPTLIHCTAGKDRTGLIIALILGSLGVPHETIVADYAMSARYIAVLLDDLRMQARENGWDAQWYERLLSCNPENMRQTLGHLDHNYGGVQNYLVNAGVSLRQLDSIKDILLT